MAYFGTSRNDFVSYSGTDLFGEYLNGRGGYDILAITSTDDYLFDRSSYYRLRKMEEIDFSGISGALDIKISGSMLRQAQGDVLTMTFADTGLINLDAKAYSRGALLLDGEGTIALADSTNNFVTLKDGAGLEIHGGAGNDTINAGSGGMLLDGGAGNDTLNAGAGADVVRFSVGFDDDNVYGFNASEDVVSLEGFILGDWDALLAITSQNGSDTVINFGGDDSLTLRDTNTADLTVDNFLLDGEVLHTGPPTIQVAIGTSAAELNTMIANAEDGTTFVLEGGNHIFDQTILVDRDNITLTADENSDATVTFSFPTGTGGDGIVVQGSSKQYVSTLPVAGQAGDTSLTLRDGHGFQAGDAIYVQQPNTQEYLDANGWDNVSFEEADFRPFRESIHEIVSVDGNMVTLASPLAYDLETGAGRYYTVDLISGISISNFTISYDLGATDVYDFSNPHLEFDSVYALHLNGTSGAEVTNVNFVDVASTALSLSGTINADVSDIYVGGSHNKGGGGNGYGVALHEAFNNTLTGLEIFDVRHSVVLSAWNAEVGNTIDITSTNRDVNLHGSPDHGNTIKVQSSILDYDTENGGTAWMIVSGGGSNHAATDMSANEVTFVNGIGSTRNETIIGHKDGSLLAGGFGYDTLIGSASDDVLIGGTRRDTMTGNEGADTFLLHMGDDLDRITDFEFGSGGDTLIFSNNPSVLDFEDLTITESGSDVRVRYGANSTVILESTTLAEVDASNFEYDPTGTLNVDDFLIA